jgi:hypothetical protein
VATQQKTRRQTKPRQARAAAVKQRNNSGERDGRDDKGRFIEGNPHSFQPGQSGNPAGRPKAVTLSEAYRQQLAAQQTEGADESTYAEVIAKMVCAEAAKGNVLAAREIADRTEGKPKQAIDVDMKLFDWRELARANGLSETDVLLEAKRLIESAALAGGAQSDRA